MADKLLGEVEEFASPELLHGSLSCEGKRGVIDELLSQVSCTVGACYGDLRGPQGQEAGLPTLPVKADRIAVPEVAGMVDPCEWLDEDRAMVVRNLDKLRLPEHQWEEVVKAFHQVPPEEEDRVVRKLLRTGMGRLLPESELPRDSRGRLLVGGLFSVLKNEREDRLIFDRRPENATMTRLRWAKLPAGPALPSCSSTSASFCGDPVTTSEIITTCFVCQRTGSSTIRLGAGFRLQC